MIYVKRLLLLALIALLGVFTFQNQEDLGAPLTLTFFKYQQTMVLGFWLLMSFIAGALIFMLVDLLRSFALKLELSRKSSELARAQSELARLQASAQAPSPEGNPPPPVRAPSSQPAIAPPGPAREDLEKRLGL